MTFVGTLIILALVFVLLDIAIQRMYQNKRHSHHATPEKFNIPFEEIYIPVGKNGQLYAWWIPVSKKSPTLILMHGWGRNVARLLPYIQALHPIGYNLLVIDARNHGNSTPKKQATVWTFAEDIRAAVTYVIESGLISSSKLGVIGLSIGGGAAINAAALDHRIQSVVTVGAVSHPIEVMKLEFEKKRIPYIPLVWLFFKYLQFRYGLDFNKIAPSNNIQNAQANIFLIHGDEDMTIPISQGEALLKAANPEMARLWLVAGKGHSNCHFHPEFWQKIEMFLGDTLQKSETK